MLASTSSTSPETYLTARQVRARYGNASAMWIVRRLANDGFPKPIYLAGARFWRIADLDAWDAAEIAKPKPTRERDMATVRAARMHESP
jgi:predicted DNA-binding transcriptional regulator AlpA